MTTLNIDELLEPISPQAPSGDDLEYDGAFQEMLRASEGQPEQRMGDSVRPAVEPDWRRVRALALGLFSRTKDLRVAVMLAQALLHTNGFAGLQEGLTLTRRLLTELWDSLHPLLDTEDEDDPTERVNALLNLCGFDTVLTPVRTSPLVHSRVFGPVSLRDIEIAEGRTPSPADSSTASMDTPKITAAFLDCELEELRQTALALDTALVDIKAIETMVTERVGASQAPDLAPLSELLREANTVVTARLEERSDSPEPAEVPTEMTAKGAQPLASTEGVPETPMQTITSDIACREDVARILDKLCDYYARNEPSSPVPLLLQRARRLAMKDFLDIMRDLAPDALPQIETIRGPESEP
jgi:type VI secretion system protein ImpA